MAKVQLLQKILDSLEFPSSPKKHVIYASSLGSCPRKFAHELLLESKQEVKPISFKQQQIFDIGNDYHNRYAKYLEHAGIHIACEQSVIDEVRQVRGRLDNIVKIDNIDYIVEFKTAPLKNWKYISEKPNKKHRLQIGYYMQQTGIHHGLIVYLAKGAVPEDETGVEIAFPMVEHYVKYTKKLGEAVDRAVERLSRALSMLPELTEEVDQSECIYCPFRFECTFSRVSTPPTGNLLEMMQRAKPNGIIEQQQLELELLDASANPPIQQENVLIWKELYS